MVLKTDIGVLFMTDHLCFVHFLILLFFIVLRFFLVVLLIVVFEVMFEGVLVTELAVLVFAVGPIAAWLWIVGMAEGTVLPKAVGAVAAGLVHLEGYWLH